MSEQRNGPITGKVRAGLQARRMEQVEAARRRLAGRLRLHDGDTVQCRAVHAEAGGLCCSLAAHDEGEHVHVSHYGVLVWSTAPAAQESEG